MLSDTDDHAVRFYTASPVLYNQKADSDQQEVSMQHVPTWNHEVSWRHRHLKGVLKTSGATVGCDMQVAGMERIYNGTQTIFP